MSSGDRRWRWWLMDDEALGELCPVLVRLDGSSSRASSDRNLLEGVRLRSGGRVRWWWSGLVRVHVAVGEADGRPARRTADHRLRIVAAAAGRGPFAVTEHGVIGVVTPGTQPCLGWSLAWSDVDDVGPARAGGARLLSTAHAGAVTVDPVGPCRILDPPEGPLNPPG